MDPVNLYGMGARGVNRDRAAEDLDPEWFTDALNVRFVDGRLETMLGQDDVQGAAVVAPYWLLPVPTPSAFYWVYAGLAKVYAVEGTTHTNITRQSAGVDVDYTGAADNRWNGGMLNGVGILNNGVDSPQMWNPTTPATKLANLTNWPASTTARVVRPFKNYLIALDVTESGTRYPSVLRWSHPADPGAVPSSWDYTLDTNDAGRVPIDTVKLMDCWPLGDSNIIYGSDSVFSQTLIGGLNIFNFRGIIREGGLIAQSCARNFHNNKSQVAFFSDDIALVDGTDAVSIIDKVNRGWLFRNIDSSNYTRCFVVPNYPDREMWFCFPLAGASWPNIAAVWSYKDNTWSFRDLPSASFASAGAVNPSVDDSWDSDSASWDSDVSTWDTQYYQATKRSVVLSSVANTKLYLANHGTTFDGSSISAYAERLNLAVLGQDRAGNWKNNPYTRKLLTEAFIDASGDPFYIVFGGRELANGPVKWGSPKLVTPGVTKKVTPIAAGRYLCYRVYSTGGSQWKLAGLVPVIEAISED